MRCVRVGLGLALLFGSDRPTDQSGSFYNIQSIQPMVRPVRPEPEQGPNNQTNRPQATNNGTVLSGAWA